MTRPSDDRIDPSPTGSRTAGLPANAGKIPPEAEAAWAAEIERRVDEIRDGTLVTYAREDVPAGMEKRYGWTASACTRPRAPEHSGAADWYAERRSWDGRRLRIVQHGLSGAERVWAHRRRRTPAGFWRGRLREAVVSAEADSVKL